MPLSPLSHWRERVVNCADTNVPNLCRTPVRTMPCEGCNQRTPCTTRYRAAVRANINCEVANRAVMWELSVYMSIHTPTVHRHAAVQWQTNALAVCVCCTVVRRWHSANCFMMIHCVCTGRQNIHRWEAMLAFNGLNIYWKLPLIVKRNLNAVVYLSNLNV